MAFRGIQSTNIISTEVGFTDPVLILNKDGSTAVDVGFLGKIGSTSYAGLVKDSTTEDFLLIKSISINSSSINDIDATDLSLVKGDLVVDTVTGDLIGDVTGQVSDISNFNTDSLSEGSTNLYYTTTRADADFDTRIATKSTSDLDEGTNLYYTDARTDARVNLQTGTNLDLSGKSTNNLSEGTNLYYTDARTDARVNLQTGTNLDLSGKSTSNLPEGTNLYYTDARADARAQLKIDATVDSAPGTLDTLNELAAALGDDANFSTTVTNSIAAKLPLAGGTLTGALTGTDATFTGTVTAGTMTDGTVSFTAGNITGVDTLRINETGTGLRMTNVGAFDNDGSSNFRIFSNNDLILSTNGDNGTALTLDATTKDATFTGSVGIGTASPSSLLHLYDSTSTSSSTTGTTLLTLDNFVGSDLNQQKTFIDFRLFDTNTNETPQVRIGAEVGANTDANTQEMEGEGAFVVYTNDTSGTSGTATGLNERLRVSSNGNVGIGTSTPSSTLHVIGSILASGDITAYSDDSLKTNVQVIDNAVGKVEQLRGVTFDRIEDGSTSTGVIAQELKEVLPEAVHTDEQGVHSVAYGNVVGLLIEAIKEQQKQIDELIKANKS